MLNLSIRRTAGLLVLIGLLPACVSLPGRRALEAAEARQVLSQAVALTTSGNVDLLCQLSPAEASTCPDTLEDLAAAAPDQGPTVRCVVPAPMSGPLRGGQVVVVEGRDSRGEAFITEFIVYDTGSGTGVLDAVWWSGLTVDSYGQETVAWRFDSDSETCDRGNLPLEGAGG